MDKTEDEAMQWLLVTLADRLSKPSKDFFGNPAAADKEKFAECKDSFKVALGAFIKSMKPNEATDTLNKLYDFSDPKIDQLYDAVSSTVKDKEFLTLNLCNNLIDTILQSSEKCKSFARVANLINNTGKSDYQLHQVKTAVTTALNRPETNRKLAASAAAMKEQEFLKMRIPSGFPSAPKKSWEIIQERVNKLKTGVRPLSTFSASGKGKTRRRRLSTRTKRHR